MPFEKDVTYWMALAGGGIYSIFRDAEKAPFAHRVAKMLSSAALAVGLSQDISEWTGVSENVAVAGVMVLGILVLDLAAGLFDDRDFIKELLRGWLTRKGR